MSAEEIVDLDPPEVGAKEQTGLRLGTDHRESGTGEKISGRNICLWDKITIPSMNHHDKHDRRKRGL